MQANKRARKAEKAKKRAYKRGSKKFHPILWLLTLEDTTIKAAMSKQKARAKNSKAVSRACSKKCKFRGKTFASLSAAAEFYRVRREAVAAECTFR